MDWRQKIWWHKKEELFTSSSMTAKKLFCNVFAYDCHNGIKSSAISVDV